MDDDEQREKLARLCHGQAALASTDTVRSALTELAEHYDQPDAKPSAFGLGEGPRKSLE